MRADFLLQPYGVALKHFFENTIANNIELKQSLKIDAFFICQLVFLQREIHTY